MKKVNLLLASVALLCISVTVGLVSVGILRAMKAERTLHAFEIVLDVTTQYCCRYPDKWPQNWEDLCVVTPKHEHGVWKWPADKEQIRKLVQIDFSLTRGEVTNMDVKDFSAIRQRPPHYDANPQQIRQFLNAIRKESEETEP